MVESSAYLGIPICQRPLPHVPFPTCGGPVPARDRAVPAFAIHRKLKGEIMADQSDGREKRDAVAATSGSDATISAAV